jgi:acyl-coenzyme A synthetase/AMP-(fatty) acid ligase
VNLADTLLKKIACSQLDVCIADDRKRFSPEALVRTVKFKAGLLKLAGVVPDAHIFVMTGQGIDYWLDFLAVIYAGCVAMPLRQDYTAEGIRHLVSVTNSSTVLSSVELPEKYSFLNRIDSGADTEEAMEIAVHRSSEDYAAVLFTSGTTGLPKAVLVRHSDLLGNASATLLRLPYKPSCRHFFAIGFNFVSAISHFLVTMLAGASLYATEDKLYGNDLVAKVKQSGASSFGGSPLQARWINEGASSAGLGLDWLMSSGDNLPRSVINDLVQAQPGLRIFVAYGLTELSGRFCIYEATDSFEKIGSAGIPISGLNVEIRDGAGSVVSAGEAGHVWVLGDYIFSGYLGIDADGQKKKCFDTGDYGKVDNDGYVYLLGRSDNIFKSAGRKVSTLPITEALLATGIFDDVVVVATAHEHAEKVPVAFFVVKKGLEFKRGVVVRELRKNLPAYCLPYEYVQCDSIPRTGSGKPIVASLLALIPCRHGLF